MYRVPASVTIAQAILESGWGGSELATRANNYFGIKCAAVASPRSRAARVAPSVRPNAGAACAAAATVALMCEGVLSTRAVISR